MEQKIEEVAKEKEESKFNFPWWAILFFLILFAGAYFRTTGIEWAKDYQMHPDERFLNMVVSALSPLDSIGEYFKTDISSLNPHNRGYGFFVYGTLPLFLVRFVGGIFHHFGYDDILLVGRNMSALFDVLTIALVFLIADRLFKKNTISLMASAFYAASVLPIQLSHYFTVDSFANFFTVLTIYFAVVIMTSPFPWSEEDRVQDKPKWIIANWQGIIPYILFGLAFGMALASKVSTYLVVIVLPIGVLVQLMRVGRKISRQEYVLILRNLLLAAIISFLAFRIFQPYAFNGPSFFNFSINQNWMDSLKELASQSNGNGDSPPALQWARRPITFSFENIVRWGLGMPLGIIAWIGFLWMGWQIFARKKQTPYLLIWIWTGFFFAYQSMMFSRTMRYQIHIYPTLAIIAACFLYSFWQSAQRAEIQWKKKTLNIAFWVLSVGTLVGTFGWAFAFVQIYNQPLTRVAASEWIYENIETTINLTLDTNGDLETLHVPYGYGQTVTIDESFEYVFTPKSSDPIYTIQIDHVLALPTTDELHLLSVEVNDAETDESIFSSAIQLAFNSTGDPRGEDYQIPISGMPTLSPDKSYKVLFSTSSPDVSLQLMGSVGIGYVVDGQPDFQYLPELVYSLEAGESYSKTFVPQHGGLLTEITIPYVLDYELNNQPKTISITIFDQTSDNDIVAEAALEGDFIAERDRNINSITIPFEDAISIQTGATYIFQITNESDVGNIAFFGNKKADESSWDDVMPLSMYGYDPYNFYDGIYRTDLNFEMYWDDNESKVERFIKILDEADYIFITSNRQWGTTVRVPERYPLVTTFYQSLIDCPEEDILWCYRVAQPGMFDSKLGFDLVEVFQSNPHIGNLISINTQFAEEAFTVYDHPKVFIFEKNENYDPDEVRDILMGVDLSNVVHIIPADAGDYEKEIGIQSNLMLPDDVWAAQQVSGTWSEIFNLNALYNRSDFFAVLVWYLSLLLLSWIVYPMLHLAFPNFRFNGYPFAKIAAMMMLALGSWWLSSNGMVYSKATIGMVILLLVFANGLIFFIRREKIIRDVSANWKQYLLLELVALVFFIFFLLVRIGNPDIWHPSKGGEKPMDFSYFNAVLKANTFPAYDPWYAGGYLNYYYYGFVIVGTLVKFLGIVPAVAYNLILPSLYSICAIGAFGIAWNLAANVQINTQKDSLWNYVAGIFAALFMMVIGNLGTIRMIWHGFVRMGGGMLPMEGTAVFDRIKWTVTGMMRFFGGEGLGYGYGNWYWDPSRAFPHEPITEFPMFTFLYADLHAHMISLPITIIALALILHLVLSVKHGRLKTFELMGISLLGAVVVGAFNPTNSWDMPLYYVLFSLGYFFVGYIYPYIQKQKNKTNWEWQYPIEVTVAYILFMVSSILLYEPFARWFGSGYTRFHEYTASESLTPFWSYITHWGFFLFIYITWLVWESRDWMANTPAKVLLKFKKVGSVFILAALMWIAAVIWLDTKSVHIGWFVMLLLPWAGILLMRESMPLEKKIVLFLYSTGLFITLFVELFALDGDLGRMNTVFKFYMQIWTIFSICSAVILIWLIPAFRTAWSDWRKDMWTVTFGALTICVFMFTLFATSGKVKDRMSMEAPHSLDGLAYMETSFYDSQGMIMDLSQDYDAIIWMQQNVEGTPVIVEAHTVEYHWGSRFTINTGLPSVLGWNWHQRQQRAVLANNNVQLREDDINNFYNTSDINAALDFLEKYNVQYIIDGQLESANYSADGLAKFPTFEGLYWEKVYDREDTAIYKVIR